MRPGGWPAALWRVAAPGRPDPPRSCHLRVTPARPTPRPARARTGSRRRGRRRPRRAAKPRRARLPARPAAQPFYVLHPRRSHPHL